LRRRAKLLAGCEVNYRIGLRRRSIPAGICINDSSGKRGDPTLKGSRIIVEGSAVQYECFRVLAANSECTDHLASRVGADERPPEDDAAGFGAVEMAPRPRGKAVDKRHGEYIGVTVHYAKNARRVIKQKRTTCVERDALGRDRAADGGPGCSRYFSAQCLCHSCATSWA
jgi:hypothetical protein